MKYGVREICEVVLKAKAKQVVGNKTFYANEPVLYFDTLKTSSLEGSASTSYATGGRGNTRLMAWEGERTITFNMEDALISPESFMILSGAGLIESGAGKPIYQHVTETIDAATIAKIAGNTFEDGATELVIPLSQKPYLPNGEAGRDGNYAYVMFVKNGEVISEPYIPEHGAVELTAATDDIDAYYGIKVKDHAFYDSALAEAEGNDEYEQDGKFMGKGAVALFDSVIVDYYVERVGEGQAMQIDITPDKFGGNYYLEASTLWRTEDGQDLPAEFIIPNCKIQSNFTFTMASTGDPSTFSFVLDAFPDYTRFDHTKKVLASIQVIKETEEDATEYRTATVHSYTKDADIGD